MSNVLVRGLPRIVHNRIQQFANSENQSVNQVLVWLITDAVKQMEKKKDEETWRAEAFQRLQEIREEIHRKHGLLDDSTKIIRHFRDTRNQ